MFRQELLCADSFTFLRQTDRQKSSRPLFLLFLLNLPASPSLFFLPLSLKWFQISSINQTNADRVWLHSDARVRSSSTSDRRQTHAQTQAIQVLGGLWATEQREYKVAQTHVKQTDRLLIEWGQNTKSATDKAEIVVCVCTCISVLVALSVKCPTTW